MNRFTTAVTAAFCAGAVGIAALAGGIDFNPSHDEMDIQHRLMVIHGSRILGASDVMEGSDIPGLSDTIETIQERLDLIVNYGGESFETASAGFRISGRNDAERGMWTTGALALYAETMIEIDDMLENGRLHHMLSAELRESGVSEENISGLSDEIVSFHLQEIDLDIYETTRISLGGDIAASPVDFPVSYLENAAMARDAHDRLLFVSGLTLERQPVEHAILDLEEDSPGLH